MTIATSSHRKILQNGLLFALFCAIFPVGCNGVGPRGSTSCNACVDQCEVKPDCNAAFECGFVCSGAQSGNDPCEWCIDECDGDPICAQKSCTKVCPEAQTCQSCLDDCDGDAGCAEKSCAELCAPDECAECMDTCNDGQACIEALCVEPCGLAPDECESCQADCAGDASCIKACSGVCSAE
jgi:hypothetical protein